MKTNTILLIGGAVLALYFLTKPKAAASTQFVAPTWQGPIYQPTIEEQVESFPFPVLRNPFPFLY